MASLTRALTQQVKAQDQYLTLLDEYENNPKYHTNAPESTKIRPESRLFQQCCNCNRLEKEHVDLKLRKCGRCRSALYCSVTCQKAHWIKGGHKENCDQEVARREALAHAGDEEAIEKGRKFSKWTRDASPSVQSICYGMLPCRTGDALNSMPDTFVVINLTYTDKRQFRVDPATPVLVTSAEISKWTVGSETLKSLEKSWEQGRDLKKAYDTRFCLVSCGKHRTIMPFCSAEFIGEESSLTTSDHVDTLNKMRIK
eukprot:TRINITY_DN1875_c1_g6_i1.p1 TRINITY_DN1875_c1_g6~~TRINITY_DN1875_c1_g6_i1.p1  ORF type:complete len:278 (-),score=30.02 TRINITY_DN1875_c1_g6_i1:69-836(-)